MDNGRMVGSLTEDLLLRRLASGEPLTSSTVGEVQGPPFPCLDADVPARDAYTLFGSGQSAVAIVNDVALEGIVTKSDLLEFWANARSPHEQEVKTS
jgi:cystathionine beta-synthase